MPCIPLVTNEHQWLTSSGVLVGGTGTGRGTLDTTGSGVIMPDVGLDWREPLPARRVGGSDLPAHWRSSSLTLEIAAHKRSIPAGSMTCNLPRLSSWTVLPSIAPSKSSNSRRNCFRTRARLAAANLSGRSTSCSGTAGLGVFTFGARFR